MIKVLRFNKYSVLLPYLRRYSNEKKLEFNVVKRLSAYIQLKNGDIMFRDMKGSKFQLI